MLITKETHIAIDKRKENAKEMFLFLLFSKVELHWLVTEDFSVIF